MSKSFGKDFERFKVGIRTQVLCVFGSDRVEFFFNIVLGVNRDDFFVRKKNNDSTISRSFLTAVT